MPAPGTLAALKDLFSASRIVTADEQLTPADIGRLILVDTTGGDVALTLPVLNGDAGANANALGAGAAMAFVRIDGGANDFTIISPIGDTYNGGQAFPVGPASLAAQNTWLIAVAPGPPGTDWSLLAALPGAL